MKIGKENEDSTKEKGEKIGRMRMNSENEKENRW